MTEQIIEPHVWGTETTCMIYVDNLLLTNRYFIKVGFDTCTANPVLHDIAFEKMEMFFDVLMNNSILIRKEDYKQNHFDFLQNNIIETPELLNDQTICCLIYAKLIALVGKDLEIQYVKLSSDLGKNIQYTINSVSPELPILLSSKEEWWDHTDVKAEPWWLRSDPATHDKVLEGNDIYTGEFTWEEHFEDALEEAESFNSKSKFKIISGGKDALKHSE